MAHFFGSALRVKPRDLHVARGHKAPDASFGIMLPHRRELNR
jgi:hypothetical protein